MRYPWPGNIRELENTIQRLVVLAEDDEIGVHELSMHLLVDDLPEEGGRPGMSLDDEVEALERRRITAALRKNGYVQARAARELGVTARQLAYKVRKYDLEAN
jgi:Nif-specific regulatory protein